MRGTLYQNSFFYLRTGSNGITLGNTLDADLSLASEEGLMTLALLEYLSVPNETHTSSSYTDVESTPVGEARDCSQTAETHSALMSHSFYHQRLPWERLHTVQLILPKGVKYKLTGGRSLSELGSRGTETIYKRKSTSQIKPRITHHTHFM